MNYQNAYLLIFFCKDSSQIGDKDYDALKTEELFSSSWNKFATVMTSHRKSPGQHLCGLIISISIGKQLLIYLWNVPRSQFGEYNIMRQIVTHIMSLPPISLPSFQCVCPSCEILKSMKQVAFTVIDSNFSKKGEQIIKCDMHMNHY